MEVFRAPLYSAPMRGRGFGSTARGAMAALTLAAAAFVAPAWAQGDAPAQSGGVMVAFSCGTLPAQAAIEVEALDDTPSQMALRKAIADDLARRGYRVADGAPLTLTFEGGLSRERREQGQHSVGSLQSNNDVTEFRLNMWSSQGDSVFGGLKDFIAPNDPNLYRLAIFVHDRSDGKCLWQGEARHDVVRNDANGTAEKLVPVLLRRLGKTVKATTFDLPD